MPSAGSRVLESVRRQCLRAIAVAAAFSIFLSLLQLTIPLYAMQVYDRVLSSHSTDTLIMLTVIVGGGLLLFGVLDFVRGLKGLSFDGFARFGSNRPAGEVA